MEPGSEAQASPSIALPGLLAAGSKHAATIHTVADQETLSGWGLIERPGREVRSEDLAAITVGAGLTRGLGRSYGDSSLPAAGTWVAASPLADRLLAFDQQSGILHAEAGLSLREINRLFWPRLWTSPVLPGTQDITLGGMVAADVHGKNHHVDGTFGRHLEWLLIRLADGEIVTTSRERDPDLFRATVGGMGLTGHILEVAVRLQPIPSPWIRAESERIAGVDEFVSALREAATDWPFTVGWFDALATGTKLGRGILMKGRWAQPAEAPVEPPSPKMRLAVPFTLPNWTLNRLSMWAFNKLYFHLHPRGVKTGIVHPESFFHPLDVIRHWNRIYGRRGFTQHQCVLPEGERPGAARRLLEELTARGGLSCLCVIKDCGEQGEGLLSFPRPGITIAIDLPAGPGIQELIDGLNRRVLAEGGRIYLAKDTFARAEDFQAMEPRLAEFEQLRRRWDPAGRLSSAQAVRLFGDGA
ncbi:MAG: FAD-binding oxidoreductase [Acidobacteria bacterium]|nr:FAD-binding oxidoreductase [Acidobacteriota bacterium]